MTRIREVGHVVASKYIIVIVDGAIVKRPFSKPQAPRRTPEVWINAARQRAAGGIRGCRHFAIRIGKSWNVYPTIDTSVVLRSFPNEDAAAVWMQHKGLA